MHNKDTCKKTENTTTLLKKKCCVGVNVNKQRTRGGFGPILCDMDGGGSLVGGQGEEGAYEKDRRG